MGEGGVPTGWGQGLVGVGGVWGFLGRHTGCRWSPHGALCDSGCVWGVGSSVGPDGGARRGWVGTKFFLTEE